MGLEVCFTTIDWDWCIKQVCTWAWAVRQRVRWLGVGCIVVGGLFSSTSVVLPQPFLLDSVPYMASVSLAYDWQTLNVVTFVAFTVGVMSTLLVCWWFSRVAVAPSSMADVSIQLVNRMKDLERKFDSLVEGKTSVFAAEEKPAANDNKRRQLPSTDDHNSTEGNEGDDSGLLAAEERSYDCPRCNTLHEQGQCPYVRLKCNRCEQVGHKATNCRNFVVRDAAGRVVTRVEQRPSATTVTHRQDRTQQDKIVTAEAVMKMLRDAVVERSAKARNARQQRQGRTQPQPASVSDSAATAVTFAERVGRQQQVENKDAVMTDAVHALVDALLVDNDNLSEVFDAELVAGC